MQSVDFTGLISAKFSESVSLLHADHKSINIKRNFNAVNTLTNIVEMTSINSIAKGKLTKKLFKKEF